MIVSRLVYAGDLFIKVKDHQPHGNQFMGHLEMLISENPQWTKDCKLQDAEWSKLKEIIKAMW